MPAVNRGGKLWVRPFHSGVTVITSCSGRVRQFQSPAEFWFSCSPLAWPCWSWCLPWRTSPWPRSTATLAAPGA